jgi:flagellar hook-basal body complex protein FliE
MSWESMQAAAHVASAGEATRMVAVSPAILSPSPGAAEGGFGQMVSHGLGEVNRALMASQTDLQQLAVGNVQNLHQIMMRLEESRLSFQLLLQVRNRLLETYQDLMKMQV